MPQIQASSTDEAYYDLCNAIILQAREDYVKAKAHIICGSTNYIYADILRDVDRFLSSAWYEMLTELPKEFIYKSCTDDIEKEVARISKYMFNKQKKGRTMKKTFDLNTALEGFSTLDYLNAIVEATCEEEYADARKIAIRKCLFKKMFADKLPLDAEVLENAILGKSVVSRTGKSTSRINKTEAKEVAESVVHAFIFAGIN